MFSSLVALAFLQFSPAEIPLVSGVGISGVTQGGRIPAAIDTVQDLIVSGRWSEPHAGDKVPGPRGERSWIEIKANKDGVFEGPATEGGYVYASVESEDEKPMVLEASGDTLVYVNGVLRAGDPYSYGYLKLPFLMKKGHNTFLFSCGRGRLQAKLTEPPSPLFLNTGDLTLPDAVFGERIVLLGAVPVVNCTDRAQKIALVTRVVGSPPDQEQLVRETLVPPMTVRKCIFAFDPSSSQADAPTVRLELRRTEADRAVTLDRKDVGIARVKPTQHYRRTFVSGIDGSLQYYAVCPSLKPSKANALILTVHGASVEAIGQARAYSPKDWCTIVAATNRRPYGFDWEDWGRMDAMEVWGLAKKEFPHDPGRTVLTGHSMGGHGTWSLGLTYPNEFAAIGPSAGWISFWSYAGGWQPRDPNAVEQMLRRSMNSSDTLLMLNNSLDEDVFILHGDKDDNVPVEQARTMKAELEKIGAKFTYHEQPGAGHWWGNECVDWPPMFDMFAKARFRWPQYWTFTTVNPAVSGTCRGITIEEQIDPLMPSSVTVDSDSRSIHIKTQNVAQIHIGTEYRNLEQFLDGKPAPDRFARLAASGWTFADNESGMRKTPWSSGPFKLAIQNQFVLVVGTHGTPEENAWARNKARYDAETWYYRGNGAVDIVEDGQVGAYRDRNLVLYGNADTNSAFRLVANAPIQLKRGSAVIGDHRLGGPDAAVLFLFPQGNRLIAVVGATGIEGMRYSERIPYFTSGIAYPDWTVMRTSTLTQGTKRVIGAGFFGNDWKFDPKQSVFLDE